MATLDLSTAVILYGDGYYTPLSGGRLVPGPLSGIPGRGFLTWIFPDLVLDPATTYRIEIDYEDATDLSGGIDLYSAGGPTEAAVDASGWWDLATMNTNAGYGTASFIIGPGISQWDLAVTANEPYVTWLTSNGIAVRAVRLRVEGTEEPPAAATLDFPCTYVWPYDNVTYPWDAFAGDDWDPPQTVGVQTNYGYLVPDSGCLFDPEIVGSDVWDPVTGFTLSRNHGRFGGDFDPKRSINFSLTDPGVYGPPLGAIQDDGSLTWFSDPMINHWDATEAMRVKFVGPAPTGVSLENVQLVVHGYGGGSSPRLWIDWQNDAGDHRIAYVPMTNIGDYLWKEDSTVLPADFPIQRVLNGEEFVVHFTIYGGLWHGMFSYVALRFGTALVPVITGRPDNVRRRFS